MKDQEREEIKRFLDENGHVMHKAAICMLFGATENGLSLVAAQRAVSTAALLLAAQIFSGGGREQFLEHASAAFSWREDGNLRHVHHGTDVRQ